MDLDLESYLNKHWHSTCRILLGQEIGNLSEYSGWLYEGNGPRMTKKSAFSGKDVVYASDKYPINSIWISHDETELNHKFEPVGINDVKDIDSIIEAVKERVAYSGNIHLGNSKFVADSTTISDCYYVLHSERVAFSKNIAYSSRGGYSENIFGCYGFGPAFFSIKSGAVTESSRIFLSSKVDFSTDIYYSHGLSNCIECLFSFNLRSRRFAIGNLALPKDKYAEIKKKLLFEIAEKLKKNKNLISIADLVKETKPDYTDLRSSGISNFITKVERFDKSRIEDAFRKTTNVIFGMELNGIDKYAEWLKSGSNISLRREKSCFSGNPLILPDYAGFIDYPIDRLLTQEEANLTGEKLAISEAELNGLSIENAANTIQKIAFFCPFWLAGKLENNLDSPLNIDSNNCYAGILFIRSKFCAFSFSPRSCEYCFGCREGRHVTFSINSHFSTRINRCFEVDHCFDCSDCYFCHNCENVKDSMFCFNVKNLKNGIGNAQAAPEVYLAAKKTLLEWINGELKERKKLDLDIFSINPKNKLFKK